MALADQEAKHRNHGYIGTEHILLGLIKEGNGLGVKVFNRLGIDPRKVTLEVEKLVKNRPDGIATGKPHLVPEAKKSICYAIEESRKLKHDYVGTEHLLLGLLREETGVAAQVLRMLGLRLDVVRSKIIGLLDPRKIAPPETPAAASDFDRTPAPNAE
jgi:ATP-dependent Clp protease ATP-binding subunit ClpC